MPQQREPCFYTWLLVPSNHNKRNTNVAFLPASVLKSWLRSLWIANRRTLRHPMRHKILCKVAQLYRYINTTTTFQHLATQNWYWDRRVYHITTHHGDPLYLSLGRRRWRPHLPWSRMHCMLTSLLTCRAAHNCRPLRYPQYILLCESVD